VRNFCLIALLKQYPEDALSHCFN